MFEWFKMFTEKHEMAEYNLLPGRPSTSKMDENNPKNW